MEEKIWRNPQTVMPKYGERVLVAFKRADRVSIRISRASHKETTDSSSPLVFKNCMSDEVALAWTPIPEFNESMINDNPQNS